MDNAEILWQTVKSKLESAYSKQVFEDTFQQINKRKKC